MSAPTIRTGSEEIRRSPGERAQSPSLNIRLELVLLTLLGFFVRILVSHLLLGGLGRYWDRGDETGYVQLATHMVRGLGFSGDFGPTSSRVPGVPLLLMIPVGLFGPDPIAIRIFMCFLESLLVPVFYLLVRSLSGSAKLSLIAGVVAIFFPTWLIPAGAVMSDVPTAILVTLTAYTLIEAHRRKSLFWAAGAGLLWGSATLFRPVPLAYAPGIILWLMLVMPNWKRRMAASVAVLISFISVLAPWSIRNTRVHGEFVAISTQAGGELYTANHPGATGVLAVDNPYFQDKLDQRYPKHQFNEVQRHNLFKADAINFIREYPRRFVELCAIRFVQLWKVYSPRVPFEKNLAVIASFGLALPFFLVQIIRRGWRRGPEMLFLFIIICHTAVHMVFTSNVRYRIPIEPLVVAMAISGFCWTLEQLFRDRRACMTSLIPLRSTRTSQ